MTYTQNLKILLDIPEGPFVTTLKYWIFLLFVYSNEPEVIFYT